METNEWKHASRYSELLKKTSRTPAEQYEMDRLLYQRGLELARRDGMTKEQFLARERVSSDFFQKAKALKLSEASFSVGGGAAAAHHDGDTEKEFAENYERVFGAEAMKIFEAAREEMKAAHVWPWD